MEQFPGRRSGRIRYADFVRALRSSRGEASSTKDDSGLRKLRAEIRRLGENPRGPPDYRRVFREFDRDGNGRIDRNEFRRALDELRIDLSSSEVSHVIRHFDR